MINADHINEGKGMKNGEGDLRGKCMDHKLEVIKKRDNTMS